MLFRLIGIFGACLTLCGCMDNVTHGVLEVVPESQEAGDCRKPATMFGTFSLYAKRETWNGESLTLIFEVKNVTSNPANLSFLNASAANPSAVFSTNLGIQLVSTSGAVYEKKQTGISFFGLGVTLNPGTTNEATVVFEAQRGAYSFLVTRMPMSAANTGLIEYPHETFSCQIPEI